MCVAFSCKKGVCVNGKPNVEAGDVIVRVNGTDVHHFTTKEVLKCLRLSQDPVTLELKRDPKIKEHVQNYLESNQNLDKTRMISTSSHLSRSSHRVTSSDPSQSRPSRIPTIIRSPIHCSSKSCPQSPHDQKSNKASHIQKSNGGNSNIFGSHDASVKKKCGFEAYMMTGDLILNLSRNQQSADILTTQFKKVDSLSEFTSKRMNRQSNGIAPHAKGESSPSPSYSENSDFVSSIKKIDVASPKIGSKPFRKQSNSNESDVYVIKNEYDSGNEKAGSRNRSEVNSDDNVDCSSPHKKYDSVQPNNVFKMERPPPKWSRNVLQHGEINSKGSSSQSNSTSSSSTSKTDESTSVENCLSVPTSPASLLTPVESDVVFRRMQQPNPIRKSDVSGFRTSRSEDHLQHTQRDIIDSIVPIDVDEDVNSSLNTLLDTRDDSESTQSSSDRERIVWTYNAPVVTTTTTTTNNSQSFSSSISSSPQHTDTPASPTSVSSSIMSSNSGSKDAQPSVGTTQNLICPINCADLSVSEAVSNISSPDYQDDENLMSTKDMCGIGISDLSDSDSTILVSDMATQPDRRVHNRDYKVMIRVKGADTSPNGVNGSDYKDSEDELATLTEDIPNNHNGTEAHDSSPPVSDDGSDVESLHSYHYSPKAVDLPSAVRLAKRLFGLEGFKKSDVSRHLSKNNDFSRAVADEYLKHFDFSKLKLDEALRQFLKQFSLSGETQERERVLVHFSKRYLDCNPGTFNSQDAVHTLTCAIMLLNTDLYGQNIGRKMTCSEFIENLAELNDGENFSKDILKYLYQAIKEHPLEWALDDDYLEQKQDGENSNQRAQAASILDTPQNVAAIEHKKGYMMRKCCYESNNKKTPFGKRSWKMFFCTLRDLVLYLHKDEHGFNKKQVSDNVHNAIFIHHSLATKATDYQKKQHVFRLQTADQAEYLFQTSDSKELQSWIDTINYVCAAFSTPPLEGGVGSQKRFQRPLLPNSHTKLLLRDQLTSHEAKHSQLTNDLAEHKRNAPPSKGLQLQNYIEKDMYLQYELKRYKTYVNILSSPMNSDGQNNFQNSISDETNILNLQSHSVNESNVNYYQHQSNRTSPHYRSTNDDPQKYELANF
ncbi:PH and SEC7 domain-containing protein isoform X2 [Sitodiplosis mosellana]|uniref:PH and SEC7 domain-containing protein isoform X2 n=1 Tax=Sitodiplosis mosellana TaxID=263140 RepID=UPI0024446948|nr:PH and SEC7 domain-containing protein isoform X2 [Sitodiplosis mosellana]